jgi:hypothetical protein
MPFGGQKPVQFVGTGSTSFDGSNDYVSVADDDTLDLTSGATFSAWIKLDNVSGEKIVIHKSDSYRFHVVNDLVYTTLTGLSDETLSSGTLVVNTWTHISLTYDGAIKIIYIDGVQVATEVATGNIDITANPVYIGGSSGSYPFDGSLKNVAIWNRALTATEIQNVMYKTYAEVSGRLGDSTLVSWWALEHSYAGESDLHVKDDAGSNNGTLGSGGMSGATHPTMANSSANRSLYGGDTPVIPRAIDNAPTVQADAIGSGSALFDGVDDYISIADSDNLSFGDGSTDSAFSISAWVKMTDATDFTIAHKGEFSNDIEWRFSTYNDDDIKLICGDDSAGTTYIGREYDTALTSYEGSWIHLAGTYSGNGRSDGIKIYLNGVQVDDADYESGSYTAMENQGEPVQIGRYNTVYSDGNICQVGIWDAVLDQAQIQSIMEKTYEELTASEKTNLVSYWALDETIESSGSGASFVYDKVDATLGSEMIPNGDFDTSANWVFDDAYAHNATTKKAEYDDSMSGKLIMNDAQMLSSIVSGKVYRLSFTVSDGTMSTAWYNTSISNVYIASALYTAGTHILYFIAPVSDGGLLPYTYTSGTTFSIDDISLKEVNGSAGQLI